MAERTIILRAEQVRALRAGATQVRVPVRLPRWSIGGLTWNHTLRRLEALKHVSTSMDIWHDVRCPYAPADVLRVREPWRVASWERDAKFEVVIEYSDGYKRECADDAAERIMDQSERELRRDTEDDSYLIGECRWRSAATMPAWASHMWLTVESVRAQRVADICVDDIQSEGITEPPLLASEMLPHPRPREPKRQSRKLIATSGVGASTTAPQSGRGCSRCGRRRDRSYDQAGSERGPVPRPRGGAED